MPTETPIFANAGVETFSGSRGDVINLAHDPALEIAQGTIALSFRADTVDGRQGILSKDASGSTGGGNHFTLYLEGDVLRAYFADGTGAQNIDVANIVAGQEYEVAATFSADGVELFVNGVSAGSTPYVSMSWETNQEYLQIGALGWGSVTGAEDRFGYPFTGAIADVEIYDEVLDAAAINALAQVSSLGGGSGGNADPVAVDDTATTDEDQATFVDVLANDSDPDEDPLTIADVTQGANGSVVIDDGGVIYTPNAGFTGSDTFTYAIDDGNGGTDTATVNVTVNGAPSGGVVFANTGVATFSGSRADVINLAHDPALEIAQGTIALSFRADTVDGRQGILSKDASGSTGGGNHFTLYLEGDVLRAYFADGTGAQNIDVANIVAGQEYEVAATFSADGVELFVNGVSAGSTPYVSMSWETNQEYLQIGALGWGSVTGAEDRFGYPFTGAIADVEIYDEVLDAAAINALAQVSSLGGGSGGNADPVAVDDTATTDEDQATFVDVLANDSDPDEDPLTIADVTQGANGSVVIDDGGVIYTPNAGFTGSDTFTYAIDDGNGGTDTATVNVTVNGAPSGGVVFANTGVATFSGSRADVINLAHDPALEIAQGTIALSFRADTVDGRQGILSKDASGSTGGGNHFTLYLEGDVLRAYFADGTGAQNIDVANIVAGQEYEVAATFSADGVELFVNGVSAGSTPYVSMSWETNQEYLQIGALGWGSVTGAEDRFGYPFTGAIADVEIYDEVLDAAAINALAQVSSLGGGSGGNADPVAVDDTATTDEDQATFVDVLANDSDPDEDPLTIADVTQGANGSVVIDDGGVIYTPSPDFNGTDSFTYTISDGNGGTDTATVSVTVEAVNDAPEVAGSSLTVAEGALRVLTLADFGYSDVDDDPLAYITLTSGSFANLFLDENPVSSGDTISLAQINDGLLALLPQPDTGGSFTINFTANDGTENSAQATLAVTVPPPDNSPPDAVDDAVNTNEDQATFIDVLANDSDLDEDPLTITDVTQGANGAVTIDDGGVIYAPAPNFNGTDSFTYTISDGNGGTDTATVDVTVEAVNDAPVAADDAITAVGDTPFDGQLPAFVDIDGDAVSYAVGATLPQNGTVEVQPDGSYTYTPNAEPPSAVRTPSPLSSMTVMVEQTSIQ